MRAYVRDRVVSSAWCPVSDVACLAELNQLGASAFLTVQLSILTVQLGQSYVASFCHGIFRQISDNHMNRFSSDIV